MSTRILSLDEVEELAVKALLGSGTLLESAKSMGKAVRAAERDGIRSHGLLYVPTYCEHVLCGKVDGNALPEVTKSRSSSIQVDAKMGFAHPAIDIGFREILPHVKSNGCVGITIKNSFFFDNITLSLGKKRDNFYEIALDKGINLRRNFENIMSWLIFGTEEGGKVLKK